MKELDWLAEIALNALRTSASNQVSWIDDKRRILVGQDRLAVLRWIVTNLDDKNMSIVAHAIDITTEDLLTMKCVLRKI